MRVERLQHIPGIGVDSLGDKADALGDPEMLRLENLDTDIRPPAVALRLTRDSVDDDAANSYLPFQGSAVLREAVAAHVSRRAGRTYDPRTECLITPGGLSGVLNVLLATVDPGREVVIYDPIYAGLVNRIRVAGGVPRFVSGRATAAGWEYDPDELAAAVSPRTAAVLMMSPAMPSGAVLGVEHWAALERALRGTEAWLIYDAAMERIRFDGSAGVHPATVGTLGGRTITVGSASKELRMIGWRVGWVIGPAPVIADVHLIGLSNVVCQVGIAQTAVAAALSAPDHDADVAAATAEWRARSELILQELRSYPLIPPHGGWSMLLDCTELGMTPEQVSRRLFDRGRIAATPMTGWGPSGARHLRLVFSNEPRERLAGLRDRFDSALR